MSAEMNFKHSPNTCDTHAFYLKTSKESIFAWQHMPKTKKIKNKIIIICPAIGYEHKQAYRSLRKLADYLCSEGFIVFRFDYHGMGNSSGSILSDNSLQIWKDDIKTLSNEVAQKYPELKQCLIGFRLGGTLAALVENIEIVDTLVLWEPIIKGRPYIRELEAISLLSSEQTTIPQDYLEAAGFTLSMHTTDQLKSLNLIKDNHLSSNNKVLHLINSDKKVNHDFAAQLHDQNIDIQVHLIDDYHDMMAEAHISKIPFATIKNISQWVKQQSTDINPPSLLPLIGECEQYMKQDNEAIKERPCFFGNEKSLFGILTGPINENSRSSNCIIIANAGAVHHVGPNYLYTKMARALAALGYLVFRMDLENIGDSQNLNPEFDNHPYQPNAVNNIKSAIEFIKKHTSADNFVISGLCSGAHTAFHAGLQLAEHKISKVLMINPLTFYWEPSMSLEAPTTLRVFRDQAHYKESIYDLKKWKKLLSGKAELKYIWQFVSQRFTLKLQELWRDSLSIIRGENTPLARDLLHIHKNGSSIGFIFASTDPGLDIVKSQAKRTLKKGIREGWIDIHIVENSDHTFSKKTTRDNLLEIIQNSFK